MDCLEDKRTSAVDICTLLQNTSRTVESAMESILEESLRDQPELCAEARDSIKDAGLRMLSTLFRVSYEISGRPFEQVLPVCAGIELLQVSALLIDDIFDDAPFRNGRSSFASRRGTKEGMALGIVLAALGMKTMAACLGHHARYKQACLILELFEQVQQDIYKGQILDLHHSGRTDFSENQYFDMIGKTTASFIRAPLVAGALCWDAPAETLTLLDSVGFNLGLAYQVRDDVVDVLGDSICTGKPQFGDLRQRRMRLPVIHALKNSTPDKSEWLRCLLVGTEAMSDCEIERVRALLFQTGSLEYAMEKTRRHCETATASLHGLQIEHEEFHNRMRAIANLISSFE